jgi:hypothetical protein
MIPGSVENRIRQSEKIEKVLVPRMTIPPAYGSVETPAHWTHGDLNIA